MFLHMFTYVSDTLKQTSRRSENVGPKCWGTLFGNHFVSGLWLGLRVVAQIADKVGAAEVGTNVPI